ncbi:MAG: outer membrane beta-barrel domain-containing protein [Gammaproteobacteria bacterium]|nr:MAG: outer membrane beta-barrel domain-containing protein [Gammaproteobacteria bacterium]
MENRIQYILLAYSLALVTVLMPMNAFANEQNNNAQQEDAVPKPESEETLIWDEASTVVEPEIERRKVEIAEIDALDVELGIFTGMMNVEDFGTNLVVGFNLSYHVTEDIFASASYGQTDTEPTSFEIISGIDLLTDDERKLQYYDLAVGLNLLPGEGFIGESYAFNSSFYGLLGVGSTKFAGDQRFTMSAGVGYRIIMKDWLVVHLEVKDHIFDIDILGTNKTTHNLNYNIGFSIFL